MQRAEITYTNTSSTAASSSSSTSTAAAAKVEEFAGNASITTVSPSGLSNWNADTGATSHMTPHRHWFTTYTPYRTPIRLANNCIVYSAGVGSVRFQTVVKGVEKRLIEFTRVLHVPDLKNNLLSVLYLTRNKSYTVFIDDVHMAFSQHGKLMFTATINDANCSYLDGYVVVGQSAYLSATSTCPLDLALWHRRLGHLHVQAVQDLVKQQLVTGISLESQSPPDPICEPCIAGKQHRGPIPKHATHRATQVLELIHSDLHGPLQVLTKEGFRYWVTFIDDYSRFFTVVPLRLKSDVSDAFKRFKAQAENQLNVRIKRLRDDKGGEYMSNELNKFLLDAGIAREHTVRNEPHQNGVAERANRTLAEGVVALLQESKLHPSF